MNDAVIYILLLLFVISAGCEKAEPVLLSGDISGRVIVYDENHYQQDDQSGVQVSLTDGSLVDETFTDATGRFLLEDIDYGNYQVDLVLEGYVKSYRDYTLHHLGGYSPTIVTYSLHEIPKFDTWIDSIQFNGKYERSYIYVTLQGLSGVPDLGFNYWCYFSDTPDVSRDQYVAKAFAWMYTFDEDDNLTEIEFEMYDNGFDQLVTDSIYVCVYPQAWGRGPFYEDHYPESLGKSSNIIGFMTQ